MNKLTKKQAEYRKLVIKFGDRFSYMKEGDNGLRRRAGMTRVYPDYEDEYDLMAKKELERRGVKQ